MVRAGLRTALRSPGEAYGVFQQVLPAASPRLAPSSTARGVTEAPCYTAADADV